MRKAPQQERSRAMVERITAAARQVLVQDGYDRFSANRVAGVAGISPGSLYQYFPNKQALLDEVLGRYWHDLSERVEASLGDRIDRFDDDNTRAVLDALLTALEADPVLLRIVVQEQPQSRMRSQAETLHRRVRDLLALALRLKGAAEDHAAATRKAWVLVIAIENLTSRWVLDQPGVPREVIIDEIATLVNGYLRSGSQTAAWA